MKTFALIGNPNCGKTTLFNALTGSAAHVGNWPGVTVDKREGVCKKGSEHINIVDLPGIYSLSPYTPEEVISRNYILDGNPYGVINIIDATNLERNLYLTTQLLEMDVPVIVALNMMDEVEKAGDKVDAKAIELALGVPVVPVSAINGTGIKELVRRAAAMPRERKGKTVLEQALGAKIDGAKKFFEAEEVSSPLFHAIKLLENDELELGRKGAKETFEKLSGGEDFEAVIADERYKYISQNLSVAKTKTKKEKLTKSDKIDRVLTHRVFAIPIFIAILFAVFHVTFSEDFLYIGAWAGLGKGLPALDDLNISDGMKTFVGIFYDGAVFSPGVILFNAFDTLFGTIIDAVGGAIGTEWLSGLVADGVLGGLFAVLGFLPQILMLFMWFSVLEDSGYMARIAFVLDRIFRRFGLSGRSFMPMIMGFGCSVPAMVNTRTLADENERVATVRVIPFFSCGAKLPILTAIAGGIVQHFGVGNADLITYGMYLLGIVAAVVSVLIMRNTTMKGEVPPFIMELPAYHWPRFKNLTLHLWDKTKHFVKKAFTIIFASTVIIWLFSHLSPSWHYLDDSRMNESILAQLGMFIQPLFTPLGFGSQIGAFGWVFAVAAVTGLVAKENVIATFGTLGACLIAMGANVGGVTSGALLADEEGITSAIAMMQATGITIPALISFIAFNMTTIPCFAACATARAELPKGKFIWTVLFWVAASYIVGAAVYTIGSWWWTSFVWVAATALAVTLIVLNNKGKLKLRKNKKHSEVTA
ncbi:ferrous iron transporter B [Pumilibacter muris]|uniref:ferrous iron transporter B n=1 Tax=Pumilibacter muris TaxID=2941510 RepID=UPI00203B41B9|nr:ferrous iron transporter B [Pumilibacter muris]